MLISYSEIMKLHLLYKHFLPQSFFHLPNNNNNSIYLHSAIYPELKFCSEALITTSARCCNKRDGMSMNYNTMLKKNTTLKKYNVKSHIK